MCVRTLIQKSNQNQINSEIKEVGFFIVESINDMKHIFDPLVSYLFTKTNAFNLHPPTPAPPVPLE